MFNLDSVEENVKSDNYIYSFLYNKSNEVLAYVYTLSVDEIYLLISDLISYFNSEFFYFSDFQLKILKVFLIILLFNIILVIILWNLYKDRIFERFMQPGKQIQCFYFCFFYIPCRTNFFVFNLVRDIRKLIKQYNFF